MIGVVRVVRIGCCDDEGGGGGGGATGAGELNGVNDCCKNAKVPGRGGVDRVLRPGCVSVGGGGTATGAGELKGVKVFWRKPSDPGINGPVWVGKFVLLGVGFGNGGGDG
jgi:hypothetical protein